MGRGGGEQLVEDVVHRLEAEGHDLAPEEEDQNAAHARA
jgi:hypothetical protein